MYSTKIDTTSWRHPPQIFKLLAEPPNSMGSERDFFPSKPQRINTQSDIWMFPQIVSCLGSWSETMMIMYR